MGQGKSQKIVSDGWVWGNSISPFIECCVGQICESFWDTLPTLYVLALFPCLFGLYDLYCYLNTGKSTTRFLKGIAILNLFYCFLSLGFGLYHYKSLTYWGWANIII
jgi:hypothetical protein